MRYPEGSLVPWLIAAALLVNGAAYWWFSSQRDHRLAVPVRVTEPGPAAPTLTLLRERDILDVEPEPSQQPPGDTAENTLAEAPGASPVAPQLPSDVSADTTSPSSTLAEALQGGPMGPPEPLQDGPMGPPEPLPTVSVPSPGEAALPPPAPAPAPEPLQCFLLGPGTSATEINRWGAAIARAGVTQAGVRMLEQEIVTGYRVTTPAPSRPEVTLGKLAAAGFEGFVTDKDEGGPQISLGLFQVRANAERLHTRLREQGYAATILPDREVRKTPWLEVHVSAKGLSGAKAALATKIPGASPEWRDCRRGSAGRN